MGERPGENLAAILALYYVKSYILYFLYIYGAHGAL